MTDQDRTQDDKGVYFHIVCLRKEREAERQKELREAKAAEAQEAAEHRESAQAAIAEARADKERAAADEQDKYQQMLKERHDEFIQRRREGIANKKRLQAQLRGETPNQ